MNFLGCLLLFAVIAISQGKKPHYDVKDAPSLFKKFIKDYNRHYKDEADKEVHYQAFVKSLKEINKLNAESSSATFDINNLADYTSEEQDSLHGFVRPGNKPHYHIKDAPALFEKFIKDYNRHYKTIEDKEVHYQAFVKSLKEINQANAESSSATYDINNFADYTSEEEINLYGLDVTEEEDRQ